MTAGERRRPHPRGMGGVAAAGRGSRPGWGGPPGRAPQAARLLGATTLPAPACFVCLGHTSDTATAHRHVSPALSQVIRTLPFLTHHVVACLSVAECQCQRVWSLPPGSLHFRSPRRRPGTWGRRPAGNETPGTAGLELPNIPRVEATEGDPRLTPSRPERRHPPSQVWTRQPVPLPRAGRLRLEALRERCHLFS